MNNANRSHVNISIDRALNQSWDTLMSYLRHDGANAHLLSQAEWQLVYLAGDGFGKVSLDWARTQCWDWSHVRDSSREGVIAMHDRLIDVLTRKLSRMKAGG
jgi:hypothetical protein